MTDAGRLNTRTAIVSRSVSPRALTYLARTTVWPVSRATTSPAPFTLPTSGASLDHCTDVAASVSPRAFRITVGIGSESQMLVSVSAARVISRNVGAFVTVTTLVSATPPATAMMRTVPTPTATARGRGTVSTRVIAGFVARHVIVGF